MAVSLKAGAYPPDLAPGDRVQILPVSTRASTASTIGITTSCLSTTPKSFLRQTPTAESVEVDDDLSAGRHVPFGNVGEGLGHEGAEDDDVKGGHGPAKDTEAGTHPDRVAAAASFLGGNLANDSDLSSHHLAPRMAGRVYVAGADHDDSYPLEMAARLDQSLSEAGVDHRCEIYPEAQHGWTMRDFPVYDEAAAERHWNELVSLFADTLT